MMMMEVDESCRSNAGTDQLLASSVVGDDGSSWRLKALARAKEQAARERQKLDKAVEERWGSSGHLAASISASRAACSHAPLHAIRCRRARKAVNLNEQSEGNPWGGQHGGSHEYLCNVSSWDNVMRVPNLGSVQWKKKRQNVYSEDQAPSSAVAGLNKFSNDGSFMENFSNLGRKKANVSTAKPDEQVDNNQKTLKASSNDAPSVSTQKLSANKLSAKVMQLQMKGKHEEDEQLWREAEALLHIQDTALKEPKHEKEMNPIRHTRNLNAADCWKKEEDADLHLANKIMHRKQYNVSENIENEYDFGDTPSKKGREKKSCYKHLLIQKERCFYCIENPSRPKHLVVAIGNFTYLMLPQFEPVVPGHCVILPLQHDSATRTVDQNVWEEIRNFKKCLLKMFAQQDKDVVFMETVISLARQQRHCMIECVPVPSSVSNMAPMYFKKAIDEAEEEWAQHEMKKLITTTTSRNLRQAVPENFAYFHVEFGLDRGFVHVIDDENKFNAGFGLNVIRGMLGLPEVDMHRQRRSVPVDKQKQSVARFMKDWEPFNWTKQLDEM
ncbi:unnamed protein product [Urochloa humidicola]